jgi:hypothetical protein
VTKESAPASQDASLFPVYDFLVIIPLECFHNKRTKYDFVRSRQCYLRSCLFYSPQRNVSADSVARTVDVTNGIVGTDGISSPFTDSLCETISFTATQPISSTFCFSGSFRVGTSFARADVGAHRRADQESEHRTHAL